MTLSKDELSGLVERVKGLTGPDREVDRLIFDTLLGGLFWPENRDFFTRNHTWTAVPREFTGSADAILALIERKLPGWFVDHIGADVAGAIRQMKTMGWTVILSDGLHRYQQQAPTLPLAILLSLLLSLKSQEPTNGL